MSHQIRWGVLCFVLLFLLTGMCIAAKSPADVLFIQGGVSTFTENGNGTYVWTVKDIIPYLHLSHESNGTSRFMTSDILNTISYPLNAALVFSGADNESSFVVEVSTISFSDRNKTLTLQVKPIEYYEGDLFKSFTPDTGELISDVAGKSRITGIYLEMAGYPPDNAHYPIFD